MTIALIIAAGSSQRMGQNFPKKFINVMDKSVIVYTLRAFQLHPNIDEFGAVRISTIIKKCIAYELKGKKKKKNMYFV